MDKDDLRLATSLCERMILRWHYRAGPAYQSAISNLTKLASSQNLDLVEIGSTFLRSNYKNVVHYVTIATLDKGGTHYPYFFSTFANVNLAIPQGRTISFHGQNDILVRSDSAIRPLFKITPAVQFLRMQRDLQDQKLAEEVAQSLDPAQAEIDRFWLDLKRPEIPRQTYDA